MPIPNFRPLLLTALIAAGLSLPLRAQCPQLVWADEFNGTSLNLSNWEPMIGDGCDIGLCGWGNNELEWYKAENATVSGGTLKITAKKERVRSRQYTSARLRTRNLGELTYGRFEARIKLPAGQGLWPAFWMLPTDEVYGGWPQSGEIDIMESRGQSPDVSYGTIHFGNPFPGNRFTGGSYLNRGGPLSDGFHVFAIEWQPGEIRWTVDDAQYSRKTPADLRGLNWPFDQRFHFLLNVAVGGTFVGPVDDAIFPRSMEVDYVRVYNLARPTMKGPFAVFHNATGAVYSVSNAGSGDTYSWSVPPGATIASGQGTSSATVNFGTQSGDVSVQVSSSCGSQTLKIPVTVEPPESVAFTWEDFESNRNVTYVFSNGVYNPADSNPGPSAVNSSTVVAQYNRDVNSQYDVLVYAVTVPSAAPYVSGARKFYLDVYSGAPVGTEIGLQLENSAVATGSNYPLGRHSSYLARTTRQNQWERLRFDFNGRLDGNTADTSVNQFIFLFDGGWNSGDVYHFDNFAEYQSGGGGCTPSSIHVNSLALSTVAAGGGSKRGRAEVGIVNNCGTAVSGASVTGAFSGDFNESASGSTNASGIATLTTAGTKKGSLSFSFCVTSVSGALPYAPGDNVVTCGGL